MSILSWLRRRRLELDDEDFQDEIRAHLAMAEAERIAEGADPQAARDESVKAFGNILLTTEAARRVWTPWWLEALRDLASDVRYALRGLAAHPAFSLTVIGVLTLGIGLNATVFSMLKATALSPLAGVEHSADLAVVHLETSAGRPVGLSYPDYQFLRDNDQAFTSLSASLVATVGLGRGRDSRSIWGELVTGNYFDSLGVRAGQGRTIQPSDEAGPGRQPVVVLGDGLWRRDFGADPGVVGTTIEINGVPLTVVGVAAPTFHGTTVVYDVDVFIPLTMAPALGFTLGSQETTAAGILSDRHASLLHPQGQLRPGVSREAAEAQVGALWAARGQERLLSDEATRLRVVPFWQAPGGAPSILLPTLVLLSAMGLLVLVTACANIAGLVLVRGVSRRGEIAVRLALGATRARIVRLLVVENLVLALPGAVLGVVVAWRGIPVLVGYAAGLAAPQRLFFNIEVDGLVVGFSVLAACLSALVFGFVPALQSSRVDLVSVINQDASPRGASRGRLRGALVVAQVAVSLLLLVGAGLVTRSLDAARRSDTGYDARLVTTTGVDVKQGGYDEARGRAFYRRLVDEARRDFRLESVTLAAREPLAFLAPPARRVAIEGYEPQRDEDLAFLSNTVDTDYFRALRIPLLAGRAFEDRDDETALPVAMVNRTMAERFWGGPSGAIGQRLRVDGGDWRTVIGVAADVKYVRINETPRPYVYLPFRQAYQPGMFLHTRGVTPPGAAASPEAAARQAEELAELARARIAAIDGDLPVVYSKTLAGRMRGALMLMDLMAAMLFVFGTAGMALAALGTYGLVSYTVRQSTHEIGIRMALGVSAFSVVRTFVARGMWLGAAGSAMGLVVALGGSRVLGGMLVGVSATDGVAFARAVGLVLGIVALATLVPAWRAARTSPLAALRHQ